MPNLKKLLKIHEIYGGSQNNFKGSNPKLNDLINKLVIDYNKNKTLIDKSTHKILELSSNILERRSNELSKIKAYFDEKSKVEVTLIFIDVVNFSKKFKESTTNEIFNYLKEYYEKVIPIIHGNGGEVEKIMGDGIIAVFGKPFLNENELEKAFDCSLEILETLENTEFESKIALHSGEIIYYQNNIDSYEEYTIIGKTITELYRLESVSEPNALNFLQTESQKIFEIIEKKNLLPTLSSCFFNFFHYYTKPKKFDKFVERYY